MTRPRVRCPNGSMANCLKPSPHGDQIQNQVSPDPNSSSPKDDDIPTGDSPSRPTKKRTKGWTKPLIDWETDKKLKVELNSHNQPIGENASKFASKLGVIASLVLEKR